MQAPVSSTTDRFQVLKRDGRVQPFNSDKIQEALKRAMHGTTLEYSHTVVKEIANDYDVDQMINRVKKEITKAASNRNVNTINRRR